MKTNIDGYEVELEDTHDGYISGYVFKGRFSASVECMHQMGHLNDGDESLDVPARIRSKIYNWAIQNGY